LNRSNLFRAVAGLLIAAFFIYFAFRGISFSSLLRDSLKANFYVLILTVLIVVLGHFIRALRWRVMIQELKDDISIVNTWGSITVGYLFNNFLPQLGEIVRGYVTGRLEDVSVSGVFGTIVLERLFDMISSGILFGVAMFLYHGELTESFPFLRVVGLLLVAGSLAIGGFLYIASMSERVQRAVFHVIEVTLPRKFGVKVESTLLSFLKSFGLLRSGKQVGTVTLYTAVLWIAYILAMYVPFFAFSFGTGLHLTFFDAFLLMLVSSVAWNMPSPGGVGVYHLFVSQALVLISGVPKVEALAYASLTYLFGYVAITIIGSTFVFIFARKLKIRSLGKLMKTEEATGDRT
jgi:glycosyltransferase 2 family protein